MRYRLLIIGAIQGVVVAAFTLGLQRAWFPLGVRGEWEWLRLTVSPASIHVALAALGVACYAVFAGLGWRFLSRTNKNPARREFAWVSALVLAGTLAQATVQSGAPWGYGLTKWVTLALPGANGYFVIARNKIADPRRFWADYPRWVKEQDSLHVGTHPPGLFLWARWVLSAMEANPAAARMIDKNLPGPVESGFRDVLKPMLRSDRAALALTGALTLFFCAATSAPLYALARLSGLPARSAWAAAALWPMVPGANLFQPTADTAYPFLSSLAWVFALRVGVLSAITSGAIMALGMQCSLVFLPVGLVAALVILSDRSSPRSSRIKRIFWTGAGFLTLTLVLWAVSGANPFSIWWSNQRNHARFYTEFPRTYWAWIVENPIEFAVSLGLPAAVWVLLGIRRGPRVAWATVCVLILLNLSGRNLSEVARLWLPFMPPLLVSAGAGLEQSGAKGISLAATIGMMAAQVLALQAAIQVVYPA